MHQAHGDVGVIVRKTGFKSNGLSHMASSHITVKELAPIVVASAIWGPEWKGMTVKVLCDNVEG